MLLWNSNGLRSVTVGALVAMPLLLAGCPSGGGGGGNQADDTGKAKLAGDLVQCQNDRSTLKEQLGEAKAEIARLKAAADTTVHLDPIDVGKPAAAPRPRMEGNIPPEKLSAVIGKNSSGLRACYDKALKHNPNIQTITSVNLRFSVKNTGVAYGVSLHPNPDAELSSCVAGAVAKWKFPAFEGDDVAVEAPVSLVAK